jgi:S-adenosylmethionine:tRNA ribosyltransferase-isomerase
MRTELFDYRLPLELVAQSPAETREGSRLLVVDCESGGITHRRFTDLPVYLAAGDCLVLNTSRVRRARLHGCKKGGTGGVELLLLASLPDGIWEALARPARRLRPGTVLTFGGGELEAEVVEKGDKGEVKVRLHPGDPREIEAAVERLGEVPLPPYIREELADTERYQTVYARELGSAAAPTAGLHFELSTLRELEETGIRLAFLRLDVGLDTFRPVAAEEVEQHRMHSEEMCLDAEACDTVNQARREGGRVIAVGTTVVRALESATGESGLAPYRGPTRLFIYPGYEFRAVDCMVTNFHMPRSSLLMLVCAFAGREVVMEAYRQAVEERYRFLSLGDACYFHYPRGKS